MTHGIPEPIGSAGGISFAGPIEYAQFIRYIGVWYPPDSQKPKDVRSSLDLQDPSYDPLDVQKSWDAKDTFNPQDPSNQQDLLEPKLFRLAGPFRSAGVIACAILFGSTGPFRSVGPFENL